MAETIKEITEQLSNIFRHLLPGLVVIGAARLAHPHWFSAVCISNKWHVAVLVAIGVTVGNVWYVTHRYAIHQLIDYCHYAWSYRRLGGYYEWLSELMDGSFRFADQTPKFREHLRFRSSQVILLFIISEVMLVFACWNDPCSFFACHSLAFLIASGAMALFAWWAFCISWALDVKAVARARRQTETILK